MVGLMATIVVGGALAWACSPDANISLSSGSGAAGSAVSVSGSEFTYNRSPAAVEIRWNSLNGPIIGRATGPHFSESVEIPEGATGLNVIYAIGRGSNGDMAGSDQKEFQVTAAGGREQAPSGGAGEGSPVPVQPAPNRSSPTGRQAPAARPAPGGRQAPAVRPAPGRIPSTSAPRDGARSPATPAGTRQPSASAAPSAGFTGSAGVTAETGREAGSEAGGGQAGAPVHRSASESSASGDLWSGFATDGTRSLTPPGAGVAAAVGTTSLQQVGSALLGFGLVALLAGAFVLELRRRRVPARSGRTRTPD